MSKKLLNESTIRRFMGLANLEPLSESFLDSQVDEEAELTESDETVDEATDETVDEGGTAKRSENKTKGPERGMNLADRIHEEDDVKAEGLVSIAEELPEEEEEIAGIEAADDIGDAEHDMADAEVDMGEPEAEAGGEDLAAKAQAILSDLADLLTQAGIETTVTSDEEELDMDAAAADDLEDAATDLDHAEEHEEEEVEMAEAKVTEYGGKAGDIKGTLKKDGHYGRGPKTKETAEEEGKIDYKNKNNESKKSSVDALVAEITSKVISRLNK